MPNPSIANAKVATKTLTVTGTTQGIHGGMLLPGLILLGANDNFISSVTVAALLNHVLKTHGKRGTIRS